MLKQTFYLLSLAAIATSCGASSKQTVESPDGNVKLNFELSDKGVPTYSVSFENEEIIKPSTMGFELKDAAPMLAGFKVDGVSKDSGDETWVPVWGDRKSVV